MRKWRWVLDGIMAAPSEHSAERHIVPDTCNGHIDLSELIFVHAENTPPVLVKSSKLTRGKNSLGWFCWFRKVYIVEIVGRLSPTIWQSVS